MMLLNNSRWQVWAIAIGAWTFAACQPEEEKTPLRDTGVMPTPVARVAFRVPDESEIRDSVLLASVRRGKALLAFTRDSLPRHVGNRLQCVYCHPDNGTRPNAMPWVGVYARFPQYRSRVGGIQLIEDRINDCFQRSMNGKALVPESRDMRQSYPHYLAVSAGQGRIPSL